MAMENENKPLPSDAADLEQYGVWVKAGPEDVEESAAAGDDLPDAELSDLPDLNIEMDLTKEEEDLLGDLEKKGQAAAGPVQAPEIEEESLDLDFGDAAKSADRPAGGTSLTSEDEQYLMSDEEELNLDMDLPAEITSETAPAAEPNLAPEESTMPSAEDELALPEIGELGDQPDEELPELELDEARSKPAAAVRAPEAAAPAASSASATVLEKIEAELSAIKNELFELKRELANLRGWQPSPAEPPAAEPGPEPTAEEKEAGGFFEEDEDETIALTGDELDNILNSADITEEKGQSDIIEDELAPIKTDIIPMEVSLASAEPVPATSADEQKIIEEYNRELDNFEVADINLDAVEEDAINEGDLEKLPEEPLAEEAGLAELDMEEKSGEAKVEAMEFELEQAPESAPAQAEAPEASEAVEEMEMEIEIPEAAESSETGGDFEPQLGSGDETVLQESFTQPAADEIEVLNEPDARETAAEMSSMPESLREEIKAVLKYMDQLLESLPEDKIQEFARSEHFEVYKRLFEELGLE